MSESHGIRVLAKDRPPVPTAGWVTADSRRVRLPTDDQDRVDRMADAITEMGKLHRRLPAILSMMRDCQLGVPGGGGDGPVWNWCKEHERSTRECDALGLLCEGEPDVRSDPTGNAGVGFDHAARDYRDALRLADLVTSTARRLSILAAGYPTDQVILDAPEPDDLIGTKYCRACYKDNKDLTEVTLRKSGKAAGRPYFAGLCKWCGDRAADIGGDPPVWMVAMHHRGDRVGPGHLARARQELAAKPKTRTTSKGKGKRRKS